MSNDKSDGNADLRVGYTTEEEQMTRRSPDNPASRLSVQVRGGGFTVVEIILVIVIVLILAGLFTVGYVQSQRVYRRGRWTNTTTQVINGQSELFIYHYEEKVGTSGSWQRVSGRSTKFTIIPSADARIVFVNGQGQGTQDPQTQVWTGVTTVTVPTNQYGTVDVVFIVDARGPGLLVAQDVATGAAEPAYFMVRDP